MIMRLVILESPYRGCTPAEAERNMAYARAAVRDALHCGEAPIASHLLYTQPGILADDDQQQRQWGIDAGLAWLAVAEASVVYCDYGISSGMSAGIAAAKSFGLPVEYRSLPDHAAVALLKTRLTSWSETPP
jgi:hypothetical protein